MDATSDLTLARMKRANLRSASVRRLDELDWDFTNQISQSPFSDIHWHPCRFPSQVPAIVIARLTQPGDWVLDPFVGSGTTLVEAQRLGRHSVGIDVNPIAVLMSRAKTLRLSASEVTQRIDELVLRLNVEWKRLARRAAPSSVQATKWYTPETLVSLEKLWGLVALAQQDEFGPIVQAAFSAILMPACRETRHWGYVCDNTMPKSNRQRDVLQLFCQTLGRFAAAYTQRESDNRGSFPDATVVLGDAATALRSLESERFACAVTSPPYAGVADYVKSQRLSMEWFELDIKKGRDLEIGARSKRHSSTSPIEYVSKLQEAYVEMYRVLQRGGWAVLVYGQSPARESSKSQIDLSLQKAGFVVELEKVRQISEGRRQYPSLREEYVIVLRKP